MSFSAIQYRIRLGMIFSVDIIASVTRWNKMLDWWPFLIPRHQNICEAIAEVDIIAISVLNIWVMLLELYDVSNPLIWNLTKTEGNFKKSLHEEVQFLDTFNFHKLDFPVEDQTFKGMSKSTSLAYIWLPSATIPQKANGFASSEDLWPSHEIWSQLEPLHLYTDIPLTATECGMLHIKKGERGDF